jgi:hypothetical protein
VRADIRSKDLKDAMTSMAKLSARPSQREGLDWVVGHVWSLSVLVYSIYVAIPLLRGSLKVETQVTVDVLLHI